MFSASSGLIEDTSEAHGRCFGLTQALRPPRTYRTGRKEVVVWSLARDTGGVKLATAVPLSQCWKIYVRRPTQTLFGCLCTSTHRGERATRYACAK